jgi:hypothetical protein
LAYNLNDQLIEVSSELKAFPEELRLFVFYAAFSVDSKDFFGTMHHVSSKLRPTSLMSFLIDASVGDNSRIASELAVPKFPSIEEVVNLDAEVSLEVKEELESNGS